MKFCSIISFLAAVALSAALAGAATLPTPVIQVDASALPDGQLTEWSTAGSTTVGKFLRTTASTGVINVGTVAGRKAVIFDGACGLQSDFNSPDSITGTNPWTVAVWVYNPAVADQEVVFSTNNCASPPNQGGFWLGYGKIGNGAVTNIGGDMGYERGVPAAGQWHLLVVTNAGGAGGWEKVWVDAAINAQSTRTLTLVGGQPCRIAHTDRTTASRYLSGSISKIQVFSSELTYDQIVQIYTDGGGVMPATPQVVNGSFETPINTGAPNYGQTIDGWNRFSTILTRRMGVHGRNTHWDNGDTADGNQVLSIADGGYASQFVNGFKAGKNYRVIFYANAKTSTSQPVLNVRLNGANLTGWPKLIGAVEAQNSYNTPFTRYSVDWTAPSDGGFWLDFIEQTPSFASRAVTPGAYVVNVDKVIVADLSQPAKAVLSATELNYYAVQKGFTKWLTLKVTNTGGQTLTLNSAQITGTDAALYTTTNTLTFPIAMDPGDTRDILVKFAPVAYGTFNAATLTLATNVGNSPVALKGFSPQYPNVVNDSFELPSVSATGQGDGVAIPAWEGSQSTGIGISSRMGTQANNGKNFDGVQSLYIQNNATSGQIRKITQLIAGFHTGKKCKVVLYVNARAVGDNKSGLRVVMGGIDLTSTTITTTANDNDYNTLYQRLEYDFTPTGEQPYRLEIQHHPDLDDSSILIDKVAVIEYDSPAIVSVPTAVSIYSAQTFQGTAPLQIVNEGGTPITLNGVTIVGDTGKFKTVGATAVTVPAYLGSANVTISYNSQLTGAFAGAVAQVSYGAPAVNSVVNLIGTAFSGPTVLNPSFEEPIQNGSTGNGSNAPVDFWTGQRTNKIGVEEDATYLPAAGRPNGVNYLWLANADQVNQLIPGFVPGQTYHISLMANAAPVAQLAGTDGKALLLAKIGGITLFGGQKEVTSNVATAPYFTKFEQDFTANASAMLLEIIQPTPPDNSQLWIDQVQITGGPAPNGVRTWSMFE